MSISALQSGLNGINQGISNMRRDASAVAQAVSPAAERAPNPPGVAESLVNLKMDSLQVQASAKVVGSVNQLLGQLLDEMA